MKWQRITIATAFSLCALVIAWIIAPPPDEYYDVQTLDLDAKRKVRITAASGWEGAQPLYSEILDGSVVVSPRQHVLGFTIHPTSELYFAIIASHDKDFIAVVEKSNPNVILMFHRFSTGEHFPGNESLWSEYYDRMNGILDYLRRDIGRNELVLSHQVPGNMNLKVGG